LASLFLATAILAIFLAAGSVAAKNTDLDDDVVVASIIVAALVGICGGGVVGIGFSKWIRGCLIGMFGGMICGIASGLLLSSPGTWPTLVIGSVVLLLFGLVVRRLSDEPERS